jgi:hypothetical protein
MGAGAKLKKEGSTEMTRNLKTLGVALLAIFASIGSNPHDCFGNSYYGIVRYPG